MFSSFSLRLHAASRMLHYLAARSSRDASAPQVSCCLRAMLAHPDSVAVTRQCAAEARLCGSLRAYRVVWVSVSRDIWICIRSPEQPQNGGDRAERTRRAMARDRSWADEFHFFFGVDCCKISISRLAIRMFEGLTSVGQSGAPRPSAVVLEQCSGRTEAVLWVVMFRARPEAVRLPKPAVFRLSWAELSRRLGELDGSAHDWVSSSRALKLGLDGASGRPAVDERTMRDISSCEQRNFLGTPVLRVYQPPGESVQSTATKNRGNAQEGGAEEDGGETCIGRVSSRFFALLQRRRGGQTRRQRSP
ncbi:hypothetical protein OH76DRAFT_337015 [Lentinus brumalis]|uniref:Uncharacterized protein n=1 Tax=Lentinus brumalis TaxID=2498619 RepID=A0A371CJL6_9APHY|nr:hypothetical protein OH76DRAFT_337015 [Polyporus brumalis]